MTGEAGDDRRSYALADRLALPEPLTEERGPGAARRTPAPVPHRTEPRHASLALTITAR
ncbi:hypothetical protein [Streptomyces sp. NBC_01235]|uniref:hypothetical protein n=1 Tax=Streptomyces sp. NBC_01235 TaxID=2903788 RepID=UPI002E13753F|nr:hypothetical protein OG289_21815 [Streptomyces sp. NBC_01235]